LFDNSKKVIEIIRRGAQRDRVCIRIIVDPCRSTRGANAPAADDGSERAVHIERIGVLDTDTPKLHKVTQWCGIEFMDPLHDDLDRFVRTGQQERITPLDRRDLNLDALGKSKPE